MADNNIPGLGRFSSQMLSYLGVQRTVTQSATGTYNNFKYSSGDSVFPSPGSARMSNLGLGVIGNVSPDMLNRVKSYYLSRGASNVYADTMTMLTLDIATTLRITPIAFIELVEVDGKVLFTDDIMTSFNGLRDPSHQIAQSSDVNNRISFKAREIRA